MRLATHPRQSNPRLGVYYGIVTSAFLSLVLCLALFEQLGWQQSNVAELMLLLPVAGYLLIAFAARTRDTEDFFVSGRRVPPVFNGFMLAAIVVGGSGVLAYSGTLFFLGFDALAIGLGWTAGLLLSGLLFVPYLRKSGAYTLAAFFGQRFRSRAVRIAASLAQLPTLALLLAAEMKIAALIAMLFLPVGFPLALAAVVVILTLMTVLGGMRSLTWSGSAAFILGAIGFTVPLIIVSIMLTNLPVPQLTYGEVFAPLQQSESAAGIVPHAPQHAGGAFPAGQPHPSLKPFLEAFTAVTPVDFLTLVLCLALGTAALPSLLARSGVTPSVAEQRLSVAWGALFVAVFAVSAPALAAFTKLLLFETVAETPASAMPAWLDKLNAYRLVFTQDRDGNDALAASELFFARDGIALALPIAMGLPFICTVLMAAAAIGIALAASASHLFTLASGLADDVARILKPRDLEFPRLPAIWVAIVAVALSTAVFLAFADIDVMHVVVVAFAMAAATLFPALLLAIWWKRCTALGAMAAIGIGFGVMCIEFAFGGSLATNHVHFTVVVAALIAATLGVVAGVIGSLFGPKPSSAAGGYCDELRDPTGESVYDRAQRRAAASSA